MSSPASLIANGPVGKPNRRARDRRPRHRAFVRRGAFACCWRCEHAVADRSQGRRRPARRPADGAARFIEVAMTSFVLSPRIDSKPHDVGGREECRLITLSGRGRSPRRSRDVEWRCWRQGSRRAWRPCRAGRRRPSSSPCSRTPPRSRGRSRRGRLQVQRAGQQAHALLDVGLGGRPFLAVFS